MMLCCTILHLPVIPCYRTLLKAIQNQGIKFFFNGLSLTRHSSAPILRGLCRKRSLGLDLECVHPGALLYEYSSTCICFYTLYSTRQGGALLYGRLWRGPVRCAVESALLLKPPLCLSIIPVPVQLLADGHNGRGGWVAPVAVNVILGMIPITTCYDWWPVET